MPLNEEVLKFIQKRGKVRRSDLVNEFGLAATSALASLRQDNLLSISSDPADVYGSEIKQGNVYKLSPNGLKHLKDWDEICKAEKSRFVWERWLAIASIIISIAALVLSYISIRQSQPSSAQSTIAVVVSEPATSATPAPSL